MKRRKDSFFGLHFDYHAQPKYGLQGANLKEEDIRLICQSVKPDFIQIDCKGHPGWTSYPSKLGNAMPEFAKDTLEMWRRVTREEDVALYMHYSGIYEIKYCKEHPEDNAVRADGSYATATVRPDSKYADELLIPQLSELAEKYGVDGFWIDGECWKTESDFSKESIEAFEKEYGVDLCGRLPATENDPYYFEFREYHREVFRRYLRHYVDALHEKFPDLQICSNWAFSDHMPERVCANVDFLSGDLNPTNSFHSARYAARALAQQKMPWDLMSWNFRIKAGDRDGHVAKHPAQIMQEAAAVIAMGGAYQNYITQKTDGSPDMEEISEMAAVSEFVQQRKPYCFRGTPIHQAALLLSTYDRSYEATRLYSRTGFEKVMGMTALLCDVGHSLEIVCEHTLEKEYADYKMIVIPELYKGLDDKTVDLLLKYAENGGKLVLVGKKTCNIFAKASGAFSTVELDPFFGVGEKAYDNGGENGHGTNTATPNKPYYFSLNQRNYGVVYAPCGVDSENGQAFANIRDIKGEQMGSLAITVNYGKGSISAIGFDAGSQYLGCTQYLHRDLIKAVTQDLYEPMVRIESALGRLEIVCLEKDGRRMIQLLNGGGSHDNRMSASDDLVPPALDIELSISLNGDSAEFILQPEGKKLDYTVKNGRAYMRVERVDIHSVIEIIE